MIQTATLMKHNDMRCLQVIMLIEESKEQNNGYIGLCVCECVHLKERGTQGKETRFCVTQGNQLLGAFQMKLCT